MATVLDELVTVLGFDIKSNSGATLNKFSASITELSSYATKASAALVGAATAAFYFINKATEGADEMQKFHQMTGISVDALQRWRYAASQAGGSAQSMESDLVTLTKALNPVAPGEYNEGLFRLLGSGYQSKYKNVKSMLLDIASLFEKMPEGERLNWASRIGMTPESVMLLGKGSAGVEQLYKSMSFGVGSDQTKKAADFHRALDRLKNIASNISIIFASELAPSLTQAMTQFEKWISKTENQKDLLQKLKDITSGVADGFKRFGETIRSLWKTVTDFLPFLKETLDTMSNKQLTSNVIYYGLIALATALGIVAAAAVAANWEIVAVVAAVAGLVTAYDKLTTMKPTDGGFFGGLASEMEKITAMFDKIESFINTIPDKLNQWSGTSLEEKGSTIGKVIKGYAERIWSELTPTNPKWWSDTTTPTYQSPASSTTNNTSTTGNQTVNQTFNMNATTQDENARAAKQMYYPSNLVPVNQ